MKFKLSIILLIFAASLNKINAQSDTVKQYLPLDYNKPAEYTIASIETEGNKYIDKFIIIINSNLSINQKIKIPGYEISQAIENLWKQDYFSSIEIYAKKIEGSKIYLVIKVKERPRLSKFAIRGLGRSEQKNLRDELSIKSGVIINENVINTTRKEINKYYFKKGYYDIKVDFKTVNDTTPNKIILYIDVNKGSKVKVYDIEFVGNNELSDKDLRKVLKKTS